VGDGRIGAQEDAQRRIVVSGMEVRQPRLAVLALADVAARLDMAGRVRDLVAVGAIRAPENLRAAHVGHRLDRSEAVGVQPVWGGAGTRRDAALRHASTGGHALADEAEALR